MRILWSLWSVVVRVVCGVCITCANYSAGTQTIEGRKLPPALGIYVFLKISVFTLMRILCVCGACGVWRVHYMCKIAPPP